MKAKIQIKEDFKELLAGISENEYQMLEESLLSEGCRESLLTWNGLLIDGHHRLEICKKHKIDYKVKEISSKDLKSEDDVKHWIIQNQLARRNLNGNKRTYYLGILYNLKKGNHGGKRASGQNDNLKTNQLIAKEQKVSESTVTRAGQYAEAIEKIKKTSGPEVAEKILNQEIRINDRHVLEIGKLENQKEQKKQVELLTSGTYVVDKVKKIPKDKDIDPEKFKNKDKVTCPHCGKVFNLTNA